MFKIKSKTFLSIQLITADKFEIICLVSFQVVNCMTFWVYSGKVLLKLLVILAQNSDPLAFV